VELLKITTEKFRSAAEKLRSTAKNFRYATKRCISAKENSYMQHKILICSTKAFSKMAMTLRTKDKLRGSQNFTTWKERVIMILVVNGVLDHVDDKATSPTDAVALVIWKMGENKSKSILLDGVKDHIIPHLAGKNYAKEMWAALNDL
jgi:hypothetical protein